MAAHWSTGTALRRGALTGSRRGSKWMSERKRAGTVVAGAEPRCVALWRRGAATAWQAKTMVRVKTKTLRIGWLRIVRYLGFEKRVTPRQTKSRLTWGTRL